MCAGRPFFMRIGVSHASAAPASISAASTVGHTRGSRSSTLASRTHHRPRGRPAPLLSGRVPSTTRTTLGRSGRVARPGSDPGPDDVQRRAAGPEPSRAWSRALPRSGSPARRRRRPAPATRRPAPSTAGTGTGSSPWAVRTVPDPSAMRVASDLLDVEQVEGGARPDDVGDRVPRPDLVELDLARPAPRAPTPRPRPAAGTPPTHVPRPARAARRPRCGRGSPATAVRVVLDDRADLDLDGAQTRPVDVRRLEPHRPREHEVDQPLHLAELGAGVHQRAEEHVPGDPGRDVEPRHHTRSRHAAHASAPGPAPDPPSLSQTSAYRPVVAGNQPSGAVSGPETPR